MSHNLKKPLFREAALKYAALGFHVFPAHNIVQNASTGALECSCIGWKRKKNKKLYGIDETPTCDAPGKHGRVDSWKKRASNDPAQIERWAKEWAIANVGIATGEVSGVYVLDLDGEEGKANLAALEQQHGPLPQTVTVITGSGGVHYYFKHPSGLPLSNSASTVAPKIDIRANGGFVIAPPSNHKSGGNYVFAPGLSFAEVEVADAPEWLIELATAKPNKGQRSSGKAKQDGAENTAGGDQTDIPDGQGLEFYLSIMGDGPGKAGFDKPIMQAACAFFAKHGANADAAEIKAILIDAISGADEDPNKPRKHERYLTDEYLDQRIEQAREFIASRPREEPEYLFSDKDELVSAINKNHALVCVGSRVAYLRERGEEFDLMNKQGIADLLAPYKLMLGEGKAFAGFPLWLQAPKRRLYDAVVFDPENCDPRYFNLWKGLAVEPKPGDWTVFREHLLNVVCAGNPEHFEWLIGWMAQMFQDPAHKMGTAIVLRGLKGTGKTTLAKWIAKIMGAHAVTVDKPSHLTGRFNSHLERCVFLNAEEGFWAGDREAEGTLKNLITGDTMLLERKGVDAVTVANHLRLLVTSNASWTVPASQDERRFFVLDVTNDKQQNREWFGKIDEEFKNGGLEGFLYDMLRFDYSHVDLRNPPHTPGLIEQIAIGLAPQVKWWHSVLAQGAFEASRENGASADCNDWEAKAIEVEKETVHQNFNEYVSGMKNKPWPPAQIGKFLHSVVPGLAEKRPSAGNRKRYYVLPPLKELRQAFTDAYRVSFGPEESDDNVFVRAAADMLRRLVLDSLAPRGPAELEYLDVEDLGPLKPEAYLRPLDSTR
jgi:hypothetical protein